MPDVELQAGRGSAPIVVWVSQGAVGAHTGVVYASSDGDESSFLHLRFHHLLTVESALRTSAVFVTPGLPQDDLADVATMARRVAERHRDGGVPYALMKRNASIVDGQIHLGASLGLTCATLVVALFEAAGARLIDEASWDDRSSAREAEDRAAQEQLVDYLRSRDAKHAKEVAQEIGCTRIRAEEVAAASGLPGHPLRFDQVEPAGRNLLSKL